MRRPLTSARSIRSRICRFQRSSSWLAMRSERDIDLLADDRAGQSADTDHRDAPAERVRGLGSELAELLGRRGIVIQVVRGDHDGNGMVGIEEVVRDDRPGVDRKAVVVHASGAHADPARGRDAGMRELGVDPACRTAGRRIRTSSRPRAGRHRCGRVCQSSSSTANHCVEYIRITSGRAAASARPARWQPAAIRPQGMFSGLSCGSGEPGTRNAATTGTGVRQAGSGGQGRRALREPGLHEIPLHHGVAGADHGAVAVQFRRRSPDSPWRHASR